MLQINSLVEPSPDGLGVINNFNQSAIESHTGSLDFSTDLYSVKLEGIVCVRECV